MTMGVYIIKNKATKALYVGSSIDIERRLKHHRYLLSKGQHCNPRLQADWDRFRSWSFDLALVQEVENASQLIVEETDWIESMRSKGVALYNEDGPVVNHQPNRGQPAAPRPATAKPLTVAGAAKRLGISSGALRKMADAGKVPHTKLPSGYRRFDPDELDALLESWHRNGDATDPAPRDAGGG